MSIASTNATKPAHTFAIGEKDFLLDGQPLQIRCGEIHFARVPREYWRHRLQLIKAMGLNTVCAYLFWNFHEWEQGTFDWSGRADAAEFCRLAQEEGLWVILRPGPYACAEWDGGGLPWWLLKNPEIQLRTSDPAFLAPARIWLQEVGRVLAPLQVTHGGPILLVQVENEYGSYGDDAEYMGVIRNALTNAGFDVPLFACNPPHDLRRGWREDIFQVVNFGRDPEKGFAALRELQPEGPLMCGEFYPGWFDTWGAVHHYGETERYLSDLEYMLKAGASFSMYMAHGGTTFGMWPGTDRPFKPDTSSYDYDAPISEAGWIGTKFQLTRDLMAKYLRPGETLPPPPSPMPVATFPELTFTENAPLLENLPEPVRDDTPRHMEIYGQGRGCILYRTTLPAGEDAELVAEQIHDFAWVSLDGIPLGIMDRRKRNFTLRVPRRERPAVLDILVEAVGHVNFGREIHDRKGIHGSIQLAGTPLAKWEIYTLSMESTALSELAWRPADSNNSPGFWRAKFAVETPADTFVDLSNWGKGVVWINGQCLARYWNIGPTQTAYLPGVWLKTGENELIILDLVGPDHPTAQFLKEPILDQLRPHLDFAGRGDGYGKLNLRELTPVHSGLFESRAGFQEAKFSQPAKGRQICLEALDAHDGKPFAAVAELDLLGADGIPLSHAAWSIVYADSEERLKEDGAASNAIDGQANSYWHTDWSQSQPPFPHHLVIDLGAETVITGLRYLARPGNENTGKIRHYRVFVGDELVTAS